MMTHTPSYPCPLCDLPAKSAGFDMHFPMTVDCARCGHFTISPDAIKNVMGLKPEHRTLLSAYCRPDAGSRARHDFDDHHRALHPRASSVHAPGKA